MDTQQALYELSTWLPQEPYFPHEHTIEAERAEYERMLVEACRVAGIDIAPRALVRAA